MKLTIVQFENGKYGAYRRNLIFKEYFTFIRNIEASYFVQRKNMSEDPEYQEFDSIDELKSEIKKYLASVSVDYGKKVEIFIV